ncbi:zinc finger protein 26 [Culicoides brevitarsis]|uniref:zinc finger protein 26 n=1 Tax=Culicoides brevitarsis TaxID=469753 RepID=UPI00307C4AC6
MEKICRVCLAEKEWMIDIFTLDNTDTELPLFEKIIQCTNIALSKNEGLPSQICLECKNDLNTAYRFRLNVEGSDFILKKFSTESFQDEISPETVDLDDDIHEDHDSSEVFVKYEADPVIETSNPAKNKLEKEGKKLKTEQKEVKSIMTVPKISKDEKPPTVKGITKQTAPDGTVKTMVRISRSVTKAQKTSKKPSVETQEENLHVCHECGKAFKKSSALRSHSKRHLSIKTNICEICNKSFVLPVELKRHLRVHTGEKPYDCRYCEKKFSDFGTRVKHERIHTQEKPFECPFCLKTFTYSNVLKFHIMIHTGEKQYACEHCNKRFIKAHQLKCHLVTHGIGTPVKRKSKQTKNPVISEANEDAIASSTISNEIQTVQVMPTGDPTQTYMLYLNKK